MNCACDFTLILPKGINLFLKMKRNHVVVSISGVSTVNKYHVTHRNLDQSTLFVSNVNKKMSKAFHSDKNKKRLFKCLSGYEIYLSSRKILKVFIFTGCLILELSGVSCKFCEKGRFGLRKDSSFSTDQCCWRCSNKACGKDFQSSCHQ